MPWCPQCDEEFPQGPACPRCRTKLLPAERRPLHEALQPVGSLPQIKVPRRYRRAFDRLSGPRPPPYRALAVAVACLVFALGFLLGRMGSIGPSQPAVRVPAAARPLSGIDATGSVAYLLWSGGDRLATVVAHDLYSGELRPLARLSPPASVSGSELTETLALGSSVAVLVRDAQRSWLAIAPGGGAPVGWVPGQGAAWETTSALLVLEPDGGLKRWSVGVDMEVASLEGVWDRIFQAPDGAVVQRAHGLATVDGDGPRPTIELPADRRVLAVGPGGTKAVLSGPALWDGASLVDVAIDGFGVLAASFDTTGERVALTLERDGELFVAVVDERGHSALKPVGAKASGCAAAPVWDAGSRWLYLASGDGVLHAVEASGGRTESVRTGSVGCGLARLG